MQKIFSILKQLRDSSERVYLPSVAELLALYPSDEVRGALTEFAEGLTERELKTAIRNFYANGGLGASAVILARRRRVKNGK